MPDPNILRTEEAVKPHVRDLLVIERCDVCGRLRTRNVCMCLSDNLVGQVASRIGLSCEPPLDGLWRHAARSAFVIPRLSVIRAVWWPTWVSCTALDSNLAQQEADAPLKDAR